jgi:hypothetical protein
MKTNDKINEKKLKQTTHLVMRTRIKVKKEFKSSFFQADRNSVTFTASGEPGICSPAILTSIV